MAMKKTIVPDIAPMDDELDESPAVDLSSGAARPPLTAEGGLTVEGRPIPPYLAHAIPFAITDQGKWEANQGKAVPSGVSVIADEWDQMINKRAGQPWMGHDPVKEAVDRHGEQGMQHRGLSPRVIEKRGMRGWEPVKDRNGSNVKIGNLILAKMPVGMAEQRNAHYREIGNEALKNAEENFAIDQEKAISDSGRRGVSALRRGSVVTDSRNPDSAAVIGVETTRGAA